MLRWYLIHTKPRQETVAEGNLRRQGYEVQLPRVCQAVRRGGLWHERVGPLFPRYLFLRLNEGTQSLKPVHSTLGVANVVRFGARYAVVPESIITELSARADVRTGLLRLAPPALAPGAAVRITHGPLEGLTGVFSRQVAQDRVVVLLELLGQHVSACVAGGIVLPDRAA